MRRTPVIVGVGQTVYRGPAVSSQEFSPYGLATTAAKRALADSGQAEALARSIDVVAAIRIYSDSFGSDAECPSHFSNLPRAVANRIGAAPKRAIYGIVGGQSPQRFVTELAGAIAAGTHETALIVGAEAMGLAKAAQRGGIKLDWRNDTAGDVEDRGFGGALSNKAEARHKVFAPLQVYALIEHALRTRLGRSRAAHQTDMAKLFAPFSQIAAANTYAQFPAVFDEKFLSTTSDDNYALCDPFTKWLVAQDAVNQGAAVLVTSEERALELGILRDKFIYLHGHGDVDDVPLSERPDLGGSRALTLSAQRALDAAAISVADVAHVDFYSCFPCAVTSACEAFGIAPHSRPLTVTGGLPFFGGAGNAYSLFAIAEIVEKLRKDRDKFGIISANGGYLTKESIGIYGARRPTSPWRDLAVEKLGQDRKADFDTPPQLGETGVIDTFTVTYAKGKAVSGVIIGRRMSSDRRFIAITSPDDTATLDSLGQGEPIGRMVAITPGERINHFAFAG